ncbi:efflux RND transporter permease subunit [Lacrimispora sp. 210928-DFI.3.58]|uniref:efflux RND transporter permease subunit n=1 Tax=Lacrimispora sp. 210928-DFI.3.58 TaxID=2883214 RepID=UPI0015B48C81|nr:efflux RND transporter permease subunit [Lacrimispora sp. 210928-DFI.3.58]MCB7317340.1 efflux RND transporter permease subunit [Lacrimispora sp. 210928-DFI.3.58]
MGLTRFVLKRPVTTVMVLLCLLVFGISSVFSATLEQMPDTDTPMLIIMARYSGAGPEDIAELITEPIEDEVSTLEGVKSMSSRSRDGSAMIMLEYDYGYDMDDAYNEVTKVLDRLDRQLPDDVDPSVMEMNNNASATMMISISHKTQADLYDYVDQTIVPEIEKLTSVAQVDSMGGSSEYIRIELQSEKMKQYNVTMNNIQTAMSTADLSYPSGSAVSGNLELSVTTSLESDTVDDLKRVPIISGSGQIVYLEDIANIYEAEEERGGISRYNGQETISLSISKNQSSTAMDVSAQVTEVINSLMAEDSDLEITVARDQADSISSSLKDVASTMVLAVIISMAIIFIFFGDYKASLIVGSSIPTSILMSLILMTSVGFSLNVITMSALVLGVGMMVDNSIVVLESCFRATDTQEDKGILGYAKSALGGTGIVVQSIIGSTITTCVVFIPLVFLQGMTGQMFKPLGYTIVFCMTASLFSAMTVVPLCYMMYKPKERMTAPMNLPVERMQNFYRKIMPGILKHKGMVMLFSVGLVALTFYLASGMEAELMTSDDTGTISVSIETRPGLLTEQANDMLSRVEEIVASDENVESYMLRYNSESGTVSAYLKDDRTVETEDLAEQWEKEMSDIENCTITVEASSSMSFMGRSRGYEVILEGTQYDELKEVSDKIVKEMTDRTDVINVHSSIENTAPVVTIKVDPVMAAAEGLTASQIGNYVSNLLDGVEVTTLDIDGREVSVMAEYPEDEYRTVDQVQGIIISKPSGGYVALSDVAEIYYKDSPASITKSDKSYQITITADYTGGNVKTTIDNEVISPNLSGTITTGVNSRDRMMAEEFSALYKAIAIAVFLVFVVMAAQFESPKFSFMVMTTIPFSLVGSFGFLKLTGVTISMTSILGFLILVGTVVNNGILYVDTVNQYRMTMDLKTALIEAGATRLRPILMTSLTTILSMIPMALAMGDSGSTTQGLAIVNIGGLSVGVLVALFILPVYYALMNGNRKRVVLDI